MNRTAGAAARTSTSRASCCCATSPPRGIARHSGTGGTRASPRRAPPAAPGKDAAGNLRKDGTLHLLGFLTRDELFGRLLTHPTSFPYLWGLAGWNIYTHHNHLDVTPPTSEEEPPSWGWHQDGYRQNSDPETMD